MFTQNPYVRVYRYMKRIIDENPESVSTLKFTMKAQNTPDRRRYNPPNIDSEVAVLIVGSMNEGAQSTGRDIVLRPLNGTMLQFISEKHRSYDSLSYPLIFPTGQDGWYFNFQGVNGKSMTPLKLYCYRLMYRGDENSLHLFGPLFHQFIVDMYAKIEQDNLTWVYTNQTKLKAERYRGLLDALAENDTDLRTLGRRVVLPSTFIGSPRHMKQLYQDAISIVSRYGKPDLFITFTCNPNWPEIQSALKFQQPHTERPDLCARVFKMKLDELMDDLM